MLPRVPFNMHNKTQRVLPPPPCTKCKYTTLFYPNTHPGPPVHHGRTSRYRTFHNIFATSAMLGVHIRPHSRLAPYVYPHERLHAINHGSANSQNPLAPSTLSVDVKTDCNLHPHKTYTIQNPTTTTTVNGNHITRQPVHLLSNVILHARELPDNTVGSCGCLVEPKTLLVPIEVLLGFGQKYCRGVLSCLPTLSNIVQV